MELHEAVAIVTGGNGGLGQQICHALARGGCHVAVVYARSRAQAAAKKLNLKYVNVNPGLETLEDRLVQLVNSLQQKDQRDAKS
jgi:NAD(P)-dependent dehydrogenase (short-subunit alcohol dehydrogenase family)